MGVVSKDKNKDYKKKISEIKALGKEKNKDYKKKISIFPIIVLSR